jgi:hypothetical protein
VRPGDSCRDNGENPATATANRRNDPSSAQHNETGHERQTADDLDGNAGLVPGPCDQFPCVTTVREYVLDEREPGPGALQHPLRTVAVLNIGGVNLDRQQPTVRVRQNVSFAPMDAFSCIIAFESPF